jgi:hypothetical protein
LSRKELPYEITKVFWDNEQYDLQSSVLDSFEHVERVLAYGNLLSIGSEEGEIWNRLLAVLESSSYYACLCMPLIRQLIELKQGFIFSEMENEKQIIWTDLIYPDPPKEFLFLSHLESSCAKEAWNLAYKIAKLSQLYTSISSANELASWSKHFLECSADLVSLSVKGHDAIRLRGKPYDRTADES